MKKIPLSSILWSFIACFLLVTSGMSGFYFLTNGRFILAIFPLTLFVWIIANAGGNK